MSTSDAGRVPVIDLFAGPGGLNEGFSSLRNDSDDPFFETRASFELDATACQTLRVRATYRRLRAVGALGPYYRFVESRDLAAFIEDPEVSPHWDAACDEVFEHTLGPDNRGTSDAVIGELVSPSDPWVLVGGPPCQAYSLAGRSRRANDATWATDHKHVLYREYLHIIEKFRPAVFVMENVKGMLSSQYDGGPIFNQITNDLTSAGPGYQLRSFTSGEPPADNRLFVVRSEEYGVPQTRHRVLLLGVRRDWWDVASKPLGPAPRVHEVKDMIGAMPFVRSRVTPFRSDSPELWDHVRSAARRVAGRTGGPTDVPRVGARLDPRPAGVGDGLDPDLAGWILDPSMPGLMDHVEKGHCPEDLKRYYYYADAARRGEVLRLGNLPRDLLPNHANVRNAKNGVYPFTDRFRVQMADRPSGTIVSHIGKDGHYFIHPDPEQMRSLTVREAARLQTFPDNYWFAGAPSRQYHQVGNAVPPWLARQLAIVVRDLLADGMSTV